MTQYALPLGARNDLALVYEQLAPRYDRLHRRWLAYAGGEAQAALEAAVRAIATPDATLLDAGCGTGAFARSLIAEGLVARGITLLDPSEAMLARCADLPAMKVKGRLEALPFEDGEFDVVTCAWALETVPQFDRAVAELTRVVRRGGTLCLAFCADVPCRGIGDWLMRQALEWRGTGRFLPRPDVIRAILKDGDFAVRTVPIRGPASAIIARRLR